jgi:hypothetical protein
MKNGIKYLVAGLVATGLTVSSYATVSASFSTGSDTFITDSGGTNDEATMLANGDLIEIGTFATAPSGVTAANVATVLGSFEVFGTGSVNEGAGAFSLGAANTAGATFTGKQLYLVAFNNTTGSSANGQEVAILSSSISGWTMPADSATASVGIDPGDLVSGGGGANATLLGSANVVYGGFVNQNTTADGGPFSLFTTAVIGVPEPSTYVLVGTGLLGLLGLRRRRS